MNRRKGALISCIHKSSKHVLNVFHSSILGAAHAKEGSPWFNGSIDKVVNRDILQYTCTRLLDICLTSEKFKYRNKT